MTTDVLIDGRYGSKQLAGNGSAWINDMPCYQRIIERSTVGAVQTIYVGWSEFGTAEGAAAWMIRKLVIDKTTDLDITDEIAGGEAGQFTFTWTGRVGHAYS